MNVRDRLERELNDALQVARDLAGSDDRAAAAEFEFSVSRAGELNQRLKSMADFFPGAADPGVYRQGDPSTSFFRDLVAAANPAFGLPRGYPRPEEAQERLRAHTLAEAARIEVAELRAQWGLAEHGIETPVTQSRALDATPGSTGVFPAPVWMVEQWATVARAAAPLRELCTRVDLPPTGLELHIPRFDSVAGVVPMQYENVDPPQAFSPTDELKARVATFSGDGVLSQQLFDRGGNFSDQIVLADFAENYAQTLQQQLVSGTGENGQLLGLLNVPATPVNGVPGSRQVTYTAGSPTPAGLTNAVAQLAGQISDTRLRAPSALLCRGARWFWVAGTADGSGNEPTERPGTGCVPADTDTGPYGPWCGLPVYLDNTIPTELGSSKDQDTVIAVRAKDVLLLEDPVGPRFSAMPATDEAGQLTVVLAWHMYASAFTQRYPSAIGSLMGTGLAYSEI
ncbi:MAG: phage major capsid protein [Solirubrobacteraceae bacterium]